MQPCNIFETIYLIWIQPVYLIPFYLHSLILLFSNLLAHSLNWLNFFSFRQTKLQFLLYLLYIICLISCKLLLIPSRWKSYVDVIIPTYRGVWGNTIPLLCTSLVFYFSFLFRFFRAIKSCTWSLKIYC